MYLLNLHTTPNGHLIKIATFFQKNEILEILYGNKTPNIFSTY